MLQPTSCRAVLSCQAPGMVRKLPNFVPTLFEALMGFLLDIEDDPDWHKVREVGWRGGGGDGINGRVWGAVVWDLWSCF